MNYGVSKTLQNFALPRALPLAPHKSTPHRIRFTLSPAHGQIRNRSAPVFLPTFAIPRQSITVAKMNYLFRIFTET